MKLYVVGIGGGGREGLTAEAAAALERSELIVGYKVYTELVRQLFPKKEYFSNGMRQETERVRYALEQAREKTVALVCSGDPELYGMAGLALETGEDFPEVEVETVAGVTAAFSGGALLGSPLTNDMAVISLSDLLTPMETILKRLRCTAEGDLVTVLYNPSSKKRAGYLRTAAGIFLEYRPPETVCGIAKNIGREGQETRVMTLSALADYQADMFTTVFIGNSDTQEIGGKMVTKRGYSIRNS